MKLDELLKIQPKLHHGPSGEPHSWQVSNDILKVIDEHVNETSRTLEIGAGVSTVLFAIKGSHHICIVPDQNEINRIKEFCAEHDISTGNLDFKAGYSEHVLPTLKLPDLDLILIDGAHGFPIPFIDWYYTADKLKVGGILIIDDTQIWTGHTLKKFLSAEPEWKMQADFSPRCVVFSKIMSGNCGKNEWAQPYVVQKTVDLLYPDYIEMLRPYVTAELLAAKGRSEGRPSKTVKLRASLELIDDLLKKLIAGIGNQAEGEAYYEEVFSKSSRILLRLEPKNGYAGITPISQAKISFAPTENMPELIIHSLGKDPSVFIPEFSFPQHMRFLARIEISAQADTVFKIYYKTSFSYHYSEVMSVRSKIKKGKNIVIIPLTQSDIAGRLRLDPGEAPGDYVIHSIEIRAFPTRLFSCRSVDEILTCSRKWSR